MTKTAQKITAQILAAAGVLLFFAVINVKEAHAASAREIDTSADVALENLYRQVNGGEKLVQSAKGVLVFPNVIKAGFGIGGSFGEGALRINGRTVDYYNTAMASIGFQIGIQKKSIILLFMQDDVLNRLRSTENWKVGADAAVTLITVGADGSIDSQKINQPIVAFVVGQKGLMYNLTLEGTKFTKLNKSEYKR